MSYTEWLRGQVERLESEIRAHSIFESSEPATPAQLKALHSKVVIHTYLKQQLLRREAVRPQIPRVEDPIDVELDFDVPTITPLHDSPEVLREKGEERDDTFDTRELEFVTREQPLAMLRAHGSRH